MRFLSSHDFKFVEHFSILAEFKIAAKMSFINKLEDNLSSAYVERKLDPLDKPHDAHHSPEEHHASGEHYHGGSRLSDAFMSLSNAIHGDTAHKTGEAFNDEDEDDMEMKRKMSESKDM